MGTENRNNENGDGEGQKKRGAGVFSDSGMTDDDRRKLRRQQRDLHYRVSNDIGRGEEDAMEFLERNRDDNNELFDKVRYTREAVLDAENTEIIASKTLQHVDRLVQVIPTQRDNMDNIASTDLCPTTTPYLSLFSIRRFQDLMLQSLPISFAPSAPLGKAPGNLTGL